jgi:hypothetical protein
MAVISKIHLLFTNYFQHSSKNQFLNQFYVFLLKTLKLKKLQFLVTAVNFLYRCKKSIQFVWINDQVLYYKSFYDRNLRIFVIS